MFIEGQSYVCYHHKLLKMCGTVACVSKYVDSNQTLTLLLPIHALYFSRIALELYFHALFI